VLAFCLGEMRMPPVAMWAATPLEIAAMLRGRRHPAAAAAIAPPCRADFAALAARYPDMP